MLHICRFETSCSCLQHQGFKLTKICHAAAGQAARVARQAHAHTGLAGPQVSCLASFLTAFRLQGLGFKFETIINETKSCLAGDQVSRLWYIPMFLGCSQSSHLTTVSNALVSRLLYLLHRPLSYAIRW